MNAETPAGEAVAIDVEAIARRQARERRIASGGAAGLVIAAISLLWLCPFYYLLVSVFKTPAEYAGAHPLALPRGVAPLLANVAQAWHTAKMANGLLNSLLYGSIGAAAAVFIAAMAAHGLSRYRFSGRSFWFMLIFAGTVFPFQMYLIPLFFSYLRWGLLDTRLGMVLFYTAICIPFPVLVLKNYLSQIPGEMDEAARMDGCSEWRLFHAVVLPNCRAPAIALFLLQFTWIWNDLLFSTVLTQSPEVRSVMSGLQVFQGAYAQSSQTVVMAATALATAPTVVLFFALRRHFMSGLQVRA